MPIYLRTLCLVTAILCNVHGSLEHEIPRRSFLSRRAVDGTRGRKFFDPEEDGSFDSFGSAGGQYDPYEEKTDLSDIRRNVPGEPRVDYPAYTTLPQTGFTCEGRSRGYYADEVSGCQVFHVCHDVLVSSFLCPIGSIFSQKLLTCDWWTKVDCSSTQKYIDVNRNSYQQDDDEMIRNAYAMISLQSGTDVTKDGLVDPDRTGSVVDYHPGVERVVDYSTVDTTGNDLRSGFDDYSSPNARDFSSTYDHYRDRKPEVSKSYQEKFYSRGRSRSPYQDSPIIRIQKIDDRHIYDGQSRNKDFQDDYGKSNEFTNQFQPSYAPTVPTVTTTTRKFYSPTVPTTFRPSTLAYNKLDQVVDSSDYFFSQSRTKSFVTPPTRIFSSDDTNKQLLDDVTTKPDINLQRKTEDRYAEEERYEDDYEDAKSLEERTERPKPKFEVRVVDDFRLNRSNTRAPSPFSGRIYAEYEKEDVGESTEDFETRGSIGLGHALRQPSRRISIQEQNPVDEKLKSEGRNSSFTSKSEEFSSHRSAKADANYLYTLTTPVPLNFKEEETTEQYQRKTELPRNNEEEYKIDLGIVTSRSQYQDDPRKETTDDPDTFVPSTISFTESTIEATTLISNTVRSIPTENLSLTEGTKESEKNSSRINSENVSIDKKDSIDRIDNKPFPLRPTEFLKPPAQNSHKFRINVPDIVSPVSSLLTRYSTLDDRPYPGTRTTELSRFQSTYPSEHTEEPVIYDEDVEVTLNTNFENERLRGSTSFPSSSTIEVKPTISSIGPWFTSPSDRPNVPVTDIVPPVAHYSDGFGDFASGDVASKFKHPDRKYPEINFSVKNRSEPEVGSHKSELHFTIRDAINGGFNLKNPTTLQDNTVSISTPIPLTRTTFENPIKVTNSDSLYSLKSAGFSSSFEGTETPRVNKIITTTSSSTSTDNVNVGLESLKSVTQRKVQEQSGKSREIGDEKLKEVEVSTANILFQSIQPETLKHIEETIEQNNSPYQVSLTVKDDGELVSNGGDIIHRLIAEHGKKSPTLNDHFEDFELVKSVEPKILDTIDTRDSNLNVSVPTRLDNPRNESTNLNIKESHDSSRRGSNDSSANSLSLLQLMAELLKLDRIPRPFAIADVPSAFQKRPNSTNLHDFPSTTHRSLDHIQTRTSPRDVNIKSNDRFPTFSTSTESNIETTRSLSKEELLGQLAANFGQPLYREQSRVIFELPEIQRSVDFQTGLPLENSNTEESKKDESTSSTITKIATISTTDGTTVLTSTPKPITTTEKTIVKTEFVPSIGFSFDTDEGREEYVEAVLGGLIHENGNKETTTSGTTESFTREESLKI